jgi:hypothetical protein
VAVDPDRPKTPVAHVEECSAELVERELAGS